MTRAAISPEIGMITMMTIPGATEDSTITMMTRVAMMTKNMPKEMTMKWPVSLNAIGVSEPSPLEAETLLLIKNQPMLHSTRSILHSTLRSSISLSTLRARQSVESTHLMHLLS